MRKTPVIIFINKMDREGRDPFDLLDELEQELQIKVRPLSWPINQGAKFKGVYNIYEQNLNLFTPDKQRVTEKVSVELGFHRARTSGRRHRMPPSCARTWNWSTASTLSSTWRPTAAPRWHPSSSVLP